MTTEEMKAELEANGYEIIIDDYGDIEIEYLSDGISLNWILERDVGNAAVINRAYAHMQERRELEALKRWAMAILDGNEAEYNQVIKDNITEADDESDTDE